MYFRPSKFFYLLINPSVLMCFPKTNISLILILTLAFFTPAFAAITNSKTASLSTLNPQVMSSTQTFHGQKKVGLIQKILKKKGIDFTHPTDKWLWCGLGLLVLSVIMSLLPVVRIFASLISLVGVVFIFIWLFKKFV